MRVEWVYPNNRELMGTLRELVEVVGVGQGAWMVLARPYALWKELAMTLMLELGSLWRACEGCGTVSLFGSTHPHVLSPPRSGVSPRDR